MPTLNDIKQTDASTPHAAVDDKRIQQAVDLFAQLQQEIGKVYVGQSEVVQGVLLAFLAGGHVLLEGVPGVGKTLLVSTLARCLHLPMSRIQFTPDLMPTDITGTTILSQTPQGGHELKFQPGPLVASLILADEINRATPKTQSALLEAMQEGQISTGSRTLKLPEPFIVLATQNPIEQEGTYPLPEAQLDRFLMKLIVRYPTADELDNILLNTTGSDLAQADTRFSGDDVLQARQVVREVPAATQVRRYAINLVLATQPDQPTSGESVRRHVAYGAGPRAAQALLVLAKARALVQGRFAASCDDVRSVALATLRHRLTLNFTALAEQVSSDAIIGEILQDVSEYSEIEPS